MWLGGQKTLSAVMLVKIEESPSYQCPAQNLSGEEFLRLAFPKRAHLGGKDYWVRGDLEPGPGVWIMIAVCTGDRMDLIDSSNLLRTKFRLSFEWDHYPNNMGRYTKELTADRSHRMFRNCEGRVGIRDRSYQSSLA
ncbi:hypothetical protein C7212DRAFT_340411 [Tuber magnatum]|uniref:Uncharacterized protein n=1 Tax=Tuber magnatum TaxID=42249 RepID=A0A317SWS7_9PEZI|nr:hypothetical protein C7212DRAFT_340411 [Tuber magnatum]